MTYAWQTENSADGSRLIMYVYDPDDLADSANGLRSLDSLRGNFYAWDSHGVPGTPRSVIWDAVTGYLWVFYTQAYNTEGPERYPILAAYRLVG